MLLDVQSTLPLTITGSFRPRLRLMWPAGSMTAYMSWNEGARAYELTEETGRFVGMVGSPSADDVSLMPYQEEPRDVPVQFVIEDVTAIASSQFVPIVIAGGVEGRAKAKASYEKLLTSAQALYEQNVQYYRQLSQTTVEIKTPDARLDQAFAWAKVGVDKSIATNPLLGTGLIAGFRTSGESERPGFAWFFGRDALWSALAITSYGDFKATRLALEFLRKFQREDGKIPHEISQSATLVPWFTDYPYAWASADATPLYVIGHVDYWRAAGDLDFLNKSWDSIVRAYRFSAATDTDGNGLIENTKVGHGWVEGGALYPPHEEIYLQGLWVEASRSLAEVARMLNHPQLAAEAEGAAERTRAAIERIFWVDREGFYGFATALARTEPRAAESGPNRDVRQSRMDALGRARFIDEDTVLPAVPLWWKVLDQDRAQAQIDHLGSGALATDWGVRILSERSSLYDPLSYHYGSVWPLFTGWAAVGAYRYGRPHVGYQALMANTLLTYTGALGYITELLSGEFMAPFGRSSHHQVWSEAMVVTPLIRGLFGLEVRQGGQTLSFAPHLPADWDQARIQNVAAGEGRYDLAVERHAGRTTLRVSRRSSGAPVRGRAANALRIVVAPAFPLDARVRSVTVNGQSAKFASTQTGDVQHANVVLDDTSELERRSIEIVFTHSDGTDVYTRPEAPEPGAINQGLRVLRSRAAADGLHLTLEGRGGKSYSLRVRTPRRPVQVPQVTVTPAGRDWELAIGFEGSADRYLRRDLLIPLRVTNPNSREHP